MVQPNDAMRNGSGTSGYVCIQIYMYMYVYIYITFALTVTLWVQFKEVYKSAHVVSVLQNRFRLDL